MCTQYLADLGAEVIKVEPIGTGDDTRHWPPFENGVGTVFLSVNRNKGSLAIDLKSPAGLEACRRLAKVSDVAVESFSPGVAERLGVGYEDLKAINPRIVYCSISGYGTVGPMREGKGYDVILQAFTGMLSITGEPGGNPVRSPFSPVDQGTGLHAVIGILGGLLECKRTGHGVKVEASLFDTAVAFLGYFLQGYWQRGTEPERPGSGHESLCPYQAFETRDHPLILGVANDTLWQAFCKVANVPEIANLPQFRTGADRVQHRAAMRHARAGHPEQAPARAMAARARRGGHSLLAGEHAGRAVGASAHARVGHGVRLRRDAQGRGARRARRRRPAGRAQCSAQARRPKRGRVARRGVFAGGDRSHGPRQDRCDRLIMGAPGSRWPALTA